MEEPLQIIQQKHIAKETLFESTELIKQYHNGFDERVPTIANILMEWFEAYTVEHHAKNPNF